MIKIKATDVYGIAHAIRGMRNPMESWDRSDSPRPGCMTIDDWIGDNDKELMMKLSKAGPEHAKYRRMIVVYCDILAPLYWWKEFDTYKIGTVANSCSTMHKIHEHEFTLDMFSHEHLDKPSLRMLDILITHLNLYRELYLEENNLDLKKEYWWQMIQLLPTSWNQKRTVLLNYEVLTNQYHQRKSHKLDEWREYCIWIKSLPFRWIITGEDDNDLNRDLRAFTDKDEIEQVSSSDEWLKNCEIEEICQQNDKDSKIIYSNCKHSSIKKLWSDCGDDLLKARNILWCDLRNCQITTSKMCKKCENHERRRTENV